MFKKLFDYFKKEIQLTKEYYQDPVLPEPVQASDDPDEIEVTCNGLTFMAPKPITNEEYQRRRQANEAWLEAHYDFNTAKGIQSIPERSDLPRPSGADSDGFRDYTCDVDYYLRFKSAWFEEAGELELAVLCLKKSNAIRMASHCGYRKDDYYELVRLLARHGFLEEAKVEKDQIDKFFRNLSENIEADREQRLTSRINTETRQFETDLSS